MSALTRTDEMKKDNFKALEGVSDRVAKVLAGNGIIKPFPIQSEVIPLATQGGDILAQAPTGSGKTLAFGLPMIQRCATGTSKPDKVRGKAKKRRFPDVRGLVLVPTRELAVQVCNELSGPAAAHQLRITSVYGGASITRQIEEAKRADIVVATPGRLIDLMKRRSIDLRADEMLVLEEADRMLDMGFAPQVESIAQKIPATRQTMLFSATLDGAVQKLVDEYIKAPSIVRVEAPEGKASRIEHIFEATTHKEKVDTLIDVLDTDRELALVFVRTKHGADRLAKRLCERGVNASAMHGGMTQGQRLRELKKFRAGAYSTLVATDVFARGIDLDNITHVVNYDPPEDADTYRHRVGRTGRAGRAGTGISLVSDDQWRQMLKIAEIVGLEGISKENSKQRCSERKTRTDQAPRAKRVVLKPNASIEEAPKANTTPRKSEHKKATRNNNQQRGPHKRSGSAQKPYSRVKPGNSARSNATGTVKFFHSTKGFGFISPASGGKDIFVHHSNITGNFKLGDGMRVKFEMGKGRNGPEAVNVARAEKTRR